MFKKRTIQRCDIKRTERSEYIKKLLSLILFAICLLSFIEAASADETGEGESLSPYFFVQGDPKVDSFPLLETKAEVNIAGVSAEIKLTQVYKNDGDRTIEALYVFPLGTKSAIHAMRMKIGNRIIEADIEEKKKAREVYEAAKKEGKTVSLLEQKRPNVFEMNVANIMPGDVVEVLVQYTEILVPEDAVYEFVFPTVVGPRFTGEAEKEDLKGKDSWTQSPYLHEGKEAPFEFDIKVDIKTGIPLADIEVTSHKVHIEKTQTDEAIVALSHEDKKAGNKDFILRYSLQGKEINSGLLLYPGEEEKFFLLMVEPPEEVDIDMVPPREYVFIVDVSGSMNGFPLEISKTLINKIVKDLRSEDYFNVMFFAGSAGALFPESLPATEENKKKAVNMMTMQRGGGGTMILNAFEKVFALKKKEGMSRILVIATDGYVAVEKRVFDFIREKLSEANFFSFGIGAAVNRYIIEGMARVGKGEPFVATNQEEAENIAEKFAEYIKSPLLTDISVSFDGFDAYEVEPPSMPDLFAKRPLVLFGKYKEPFGSIMIKGNTAEGKYEKEIVVNTSIEDSKNASLRYLWAREKIARLADYGRVGVNVQEEVTALGLKYHLMTDYTSFVAVDKVIRDTGEVVTVKQPLPLPEGVSDLAVGGKHAPAFYLPMSMNAPPAKASVRKQLKIKSIGGTRGTEQKEPAEVLREELVEEERIDFAKAETPRDKKDAGDILITSGVFPAGITLDDVEKIISDQIENELKKAFGDCTLETITIKLEVENGKVKEVKIKEIKSMKCDEKEIKNIFKKLKFDKSLKGTLEISLKYI